MSVSVRCFTAIPGFLILFAAFGCAEPSVESNASEEVTSGEQVSTTNSSENETDSESTAGGSTDPALDVLQGPWVVTHVEYKGEDVAGIAGTRAVITGDEVAIGSPGASIVSSMTLDAAKDPAWMDTVNPSGKTLAIYKLEGDKLWICAGPANAGKDRPADFLTAADSEAMLFEYERATE